MTKQEKGQEQGQEQGEDTFWGRIGNGAYTILGTVALLLACKYLDPSNHPGRFY